ncbi:hypothetical protein LguiB_010353 [Lonicera macranthoides]
MQERRSVINHQISIFLPGKEIPDWFSEQDRGVSLVLQLPPNWHEEITGFAMCFVLNNSDFPELGDALVKGSIRIGGGGNFMSAGFTIKVETRPMAGFEHVWMGYTSLDFFHQNVMPDPDSHTPDDWLGIVEGKGDLRISCPTIRGKCEVRLMYKKDVKQQQQMTTMHVEEDSNSNIISTSSPPSPGGIWGPPQGRGLAFSRLPLSWKDGHPLLPAAELQKYVLKRHDDLDGLSTELSNLFRDVGEKIREEFSVNGVGNELAIEAPTNPAEFDASAQSINKEAESIVTFSRAFALHLKIELETRRSSQRFNPPRTMNTPQMHSSQNNQSNPRIASQCQSSQKSSTRTKDFLTRNAPKNCSREMALTLISSHSMGNSIINHQFSIILPGSDIPDSFTYQEKGKFPVLQLPPNWQNKIMGFAMCFVFDSSFPLKDGGGNIHVRSKSDLVTARFNFYNMSYQMLFENDHFWMGYVSLDLILQSYLDPRWIDSKHHKKDDWFAIEEGYLSLFLRWVPGKCGVRLVYKEDVKQKTTITTRMSKDSSQSRSFKFLHPRGFQRMDMHVERAYSNTVIMLVCIEDLLREEWSGIQNP